MAFFRSPSRGFGLVELMISIVPGLVVSGAAVAFVISTLSSNTNFVRSTRFNQDLRSNMDFVTRELRRAGYDENALKYIALTASNNTVSPFASVKVVRGAADNSCVIFAYDSKAAAVSGDKAQCKAGNVVVRIDPRYFRPTEVETLLGDASKAQIKLGWTPKITLAAW